MENRRTKKDKGKIPHLIFVDLKSAFDSVNWLILGRRLRLYLVPSSIINTIEQLYSKAHTSPTD